jgi:hypothetical protein
LGEAVPAVKFENFLVGALECAGSVMFEEDASACADVLVMEELLVVRALPSAAVERVQGAATLFHPCKPVRSLKCVVFAHV